MRAERTAATGGGIHETHDYSLRAGDEHLEIASRWTNRATKKVKVKPQPFVKGLRGVTSAPKGTTHFCASILELGQTFLSWLVG